MRAARLAWGAALLLLLGGCSPDEGQWQLLGTELPEALLSVGGTSSRDVYAVGADRGLGPAVLHFDGSRWRRLDTAHRGDLWWVHAFPAGPVLMGGAGGTILRYESGRFTRMPTPGLAHATVFGLWGQRPDSVYAVGAAAGRAGFLWHYDGQAWRELRLPVEALPRTSDGSLPALYKVWGDASGQVWAVGAQGVILRLRPGGVPEVVPSGSEQRLLTVHGAAGVVVAVGGEGNGTLLERGDADRFSAQGPPAAALLQGVALREDGTGYAVGATGLVLQRDEDGAWTPARHGQAVSAESLHAVWLSPEGDTWAVGGNVLGTRLDGGVLLHRGPQRLPRVVPPAAAPPASVACPAAQVDPFPDRSIARRWNEQALAAIRRDLPRPGVHARNLFHLSAALWDAWAAYDATAQGLFYREKHAVADVASARHEALSYAAYRVLTHRYGRAVGGDVSLQCLRAFMAALQLDPDVRVDATGARAVGERVADAVLGAAADDGANEAANYADTTAFVSHNPPLVLEAAGAPMSAPAEWQPLDLAVAVTQNGIQTASGVQGYIGAHWGLVTPFALTRPAAGALYLDPGAPPAFDAATRAHAVDILRRSSELDDDTLVDISPGALGNNSLGQDDGRGHPVNPVTGQPYAPVQVRRGDFGRVLAEYWADGPRSETPPGHWNVIANATADAAGFERRWEGTGEPLEALAWDVRTYLVLNGALHDAAIAAWEVKRAFVTARPISLIRHMGRLGQSTDPAGAAYHPDGLPLIPGLIERVSAESASPGQRHAHLAYAVGQVAVRAWRGQPGDRVNDVGGGGWVRAVDWMPYQVRSFVTPAFPGFVSGHSTFSRAAAEVLASVTGTPYFPGGLGQFVAFRDSYLTFERGPASDVRLQWATYYDAADQAGQSRLWGGIHLQPDDFVGRRMGEQVSRAALARARPLLSPPPAPQPLAARSR